MAQIQYFLGGNTPSGFYSLYHELSDPRRMQALYILKGGAGCGKSSLMKRVARHAQAAGLETVLIPCSGDPHSLDGVILPQISAAIVDGTAPQVAAPKGHAIRKISNKAQLKSGLAGPFSYRPDRFSSAPVLPQAHRVAHQPDRFFLSPYHFYQGNRPSLRETPVYSVQEAK